jgi:hypothetical protein
LKISFFGFVWLLKFHVELPDPLLDLFVDEVLISVVDYGFPLYPAVAIVLNYLCNTSFLIVFGFCELYVFSTLTVKKNLVFVMFVFAIMLKEHAN